MTADVSGVMAVLAAHVFGGRAYYQRTHQWTATCRADAWTERGDMGGLDAAHTAHRAHVADAIAAALGDPEQAMREALDEAADAVEDECSHTSRPCFCGSADWLRQRAARPYREATR